jgi:hypothetical protein
MGQASRVLDQAAVYSSVPRRTIMKLVLIVLGLLATTGVVYAACMFC